MAVKQTVDFDSKVTLIGKHYSPAMEEWEKDGKKMPATPESFELVVIVGTKRTDCPELYAELPVVLAVTVDKMDYLRIKGRKELNATLRQRNNALSIRSLEGIPVILKKEDTDEEELFARELAEIERMEAMATQEKTAKK